MGMFCTLEENGALQEEQLKMIEIFSELRTESRMKLAEREVDHFYQKRQAIYYEGNPALGIHLVKSGQIKTIKLSSEGKQHILSILNPGDVLGMSEILTGGRYHTTAVMLQEGAIGFIDSQTVLEVLKSDSSVALKVMEYLSKGLQDSAEERVHLAHKAVRERMARLLLMLSSRYGIENQGSVRIRLDLSREELADMIGTAAETAIRLLKEFKEEKMVDLQGKIIVLLDQKRLGKAANL